MSSLPWMSHQAILDALENVLLYPQKWRVVSSLIPFEVQPVSAPEHQKWSQCHAHDHTYREILIALSGTCTYGFQNRIFPCMPGSIFLFDLDEPHDFNYHPTANNLLHLWIGMLGDHFIANIIEVHQGQYKQIPGSPLLQFLDEAGEFLFKNWSECRRNTQWPDALIRAKLVSAIGLLASDIVKTGLPVKVKRGDRAVQERIISGICHRIFTTAGRGVSLDLLAQATGYNKFYLSRLFRAKVGCTIHQYIDQCRAKLVKELLGQGHTKKSISAKLGFSSPTAFSRWLKDNPLETTHNQV